MIYRIVQELINNTVKHANASEAIVQLMGSEKGLHLTVEDNGCGFDPKKLKTPGVGINNIRSRVDFLNGALEFNSEIGVGTTINVEVPI
jgi:two-component system NarL family sensor kinase